LSSLGLGLDVVTNRKLLNLGTGHHSGTVETGAESPCLPMIVKNVSMSQVAVVSDLDFGVILVVNYNQFHHIVVLFYL